MNTPKQLQGVWCSAECTLPLWKIICDKGRWSQRRHQCYLKSVRFPWGSRAHHTSLVQLHLVLPGLKELLHWDLCRAQPALISLPSAPLGFHLGFEVLSEISPSNSESGETTGYGKSTRQPGQKCQRGKGFFLCSVILIANNSQTGLGEIFHLLLYKVRIFQFSERMMSQLILSLIFFSTSSTKFD